MNENLYLEYGMGKIKSMLICQEEELHSMYTELADLEIQLAFLEHEKYSLNARIESQKDLIYNKQAEINNHIDCMSAALEEQKT